MQDQMLWLTPHHTSYDFFNSDKVKKMRNDLLNGKRLADCRVCQYQEKIGHHSHRQKYNEYCGISPQPLSATKFMKCSDRTTCFV